MFSFSMKKLVCLCILLVTSVFVLGACRRGEDEPIDFAALVGGEGIFAIPRDTVGEITVMMWAGSGEFLRDVGRNYIPQEDIWGMNDAAIIAVARVFNRYFPYITINANTVTGGHGYIWDQHRDNFRLEFGHWPDVFAVADLVSDVQRGHVADLSIFRDDPMFQAFNPMIMQMMELGGRQFAIPEYVLPQGVFVNHSLAERENIDVPHHTWNFDEFVRFQMHSRANDFYGTVGAPFRMVDSGTRDVLWSLVDPNRGPNDPFVNLNSEAVRNIISQLPQVLDHGIWAQSALGNIDAAFMDTHWWWGARFFSQGVLLSHAHEAYMLAAMVNPADGMYVLAENWDYFPLPSTPYVGNHVTLILDPMGIRNFAMDDGNPILSPSEYAQLAIAWEFSKFFAGDTRAWEARANQHFNLGDGNFRNAMSPSFPFVTGQAFYDQMDIWFDTIGARFRDPVRTPGFHYVMDLLLRGEFPAWTYKTTPWWHEFEGSPRRIMHEWINMWNAAYAGASDLEPHWVDMLFARLPEWDVEINQRFADAFAHLYGQIALFYPEQVRGGR